MNSFIVLSMDNCTFQIYTEQDITLTNSSELNKGMLFFERLQEHQTKARS